MANVSRFIPFAVFLCFIATTCAFGQAGFDDSQMRQITAVRIKTVHGVDVDWRHTTLVEITDIEARLNTAARIEQGHGLLFDWKANSLLQLTDAEARLNTVKRIKENHGLEIDWQKASLRQLIDTEARMNSAERIAGVTEQPVDSSKDSLEDLLPMESVAAETNANLNSRVLPFYVLFPLVSQKSMGLEKLTESEKQALHKHVEELLVAAVQGGTQRTQSNQMASPVTVPSVPSAVIETKIEGAFEGWEGQTVVKLLNGQIWQQTEYYYHYHYAFMPDVLIYRSGAGWKMEVEGIDQAVGVTQLK